MKPPLEIGDPVSLGSLFVGQIPCKVHRLNQKTKLPSHLIVTETVEHKYKEGAIVELEPGFWDDFQIKELREKSGRGLQDTKKAFEWAKGDMLLAEGYLRFFDCAINVKPQGSETQAEAFDRWLRQKAGEFARQKQKP